MSDLNTIDENRIRVIRRQDAEPTPDAVHGSAGKTVRGTDGKFIGNPVSGDKSGSVDIQWSVRIPKGLAEAMKECDPVTNRPYWRAHFKSRDAMVSELIRAWLMQVIG